MNGFRCAHSIARMGLWVISRCFFFSLALVQRFYICRCTKWSWRQQQSWTLCRRKSLGKGEGYHHVTGHVWPTGGSCDKVPLTFILIYDWHCQASLISLSSAAVHPDLWLTLSSISHIQFSTVGTESLKSEDWVSKPWGLILRLQII
jgi:hypothetical protein